MVSLTSIRACLSKFLMVAVYQCGLLYFSRFISHQTVDLYSVIVVFSLTFIA